MNIIVVEHNPHWREMYLEEEREIQEILSDVLVNSYHMGSTAVPGLKAKPIIDILLVVTDINALDNYTLPFEKLGYEVMGEFGIRGRRYFRKGGDNRTHQIHAFQFDHIQEIERHLIFRDYLCHQPEVVKDYGELKSMLAQKYPNDIEAYGDGKDDFVKKVEKQALLWHWTIR
ncbi:GrpB family protein [Paenibacillus guangzhouensis]|uniref:GrpB family protein n=1 Tax=Paenibacillus guangzhouensis TaxID=1473112 RepID=UPI001266C4DE|nr:GrpB family protein [Paenibacillus guangzhouensis]